MYEIIALPYFHTGKLKTQCSYTILTWHFKDMTQLYNINLTLQNMTQLQDINLTLLKHDTTTQYKHDTPKV